MPKGRSRDDVERDEEYVPPLPHRGAPADRVMPTDLDERTPPPMEERVQLERMDGEGGGSAPLQDAPAETDLRVAKAKREKDRERKRTGWVEKT